MIYNKDFITDIYKLVTEVFICLRDYYSEC